MVITEQLKKELVTLARKFGVALFVLFGSQARSDARRNSDIDLAYSSREPMSLQKENKMAVALHEMFGTSHIDIVNLSDAPPLLLKRITDEGMPLFEAKPSLFVELYLYANKVYLETRPLLELRRGYLLRRAEQYKKELAYA